MIRKIKALGLALVAVMAVSGVVASGAQAVAEIHIRSGKNSIITSDESLQQHAWILGTSETRCQQVTLEGTITGSGGTQTRASHVLVTPSYKNCQFLGEPEIVQMNGCKFTLQGTATALRFNARVVGCTAGKQITIQTSACQIHIPEQGELEHVVLANRQNAPRLEDVDMKLTISGITGIEKRGVLCPSALQMSLTGETTVQAYEDTGVKDQVTVTEHQYEKTTDNGVELGIEAT